MEWQAYVSDLSLECDENDRLINDRVVVLAARQQGKTLWLVVRILWELFVRGSKLSIHTAQDRALAREIFQKVVETAQANPYLAPEIAEVRLANGQEEIRLKSGARYKIVAPTEAAARGLSVDGVAIIDEAREQKDWGLWGAISKTTLATDNPQIIVTSNAGHALSVVLNDFRDRGRAAAANPEADPSLCYMEWSADPAYEIGDVRGWAQANPALGTTVKLEKLESAFRTDPSAVFSTEVLCRWVETMAGILPENAWANCASPNLAKIEGGAVVYLAFDISPSRDECALIAASYVDGGKLAVSVVEHWLNPRGVDEQSIAAAIQKWATHFVVPVVAYDPRFAWSIAARIESQGVPVKDIGGVRFYRASQEFYEAVTNGRIAHPDDPYLNAQIEAAARQDVADGSWRISRKQSTQSIVATVALAMAIHVATDPASGVAIY
jgi:phage terminase large subunit-like protein